jgi:hypothetical protein
LDDFVDEFDVVLNVVFFDIKGVNYRCKSLVEEVERVVLEFAVNRVHFCHLEINNFNEVKHVRDVG